MVKLVTRVPTPLIRTGLGAALALAAAPVAAQMWFDVPALMSPVVTNQCTGGRCGPDEEDGPPPAVRLNQGVHNALTADVPARPHASAVELTYKSLTERRRANLAQFVDKTRARDPEGAAQLEQLFNSSDIIETIGQGIAPYGLSANNLADAYTVYWMNAWQAANGDPSASFTRAQAQAVKAQAADALLATPEMAQASDAQKQEMAEAMLIQAAMINAATDQAAGNAAQLEQIGAAVRQGAKASGLDLDAMRLTEEGFVPA